GENGVRNTFDVKAFRRDLVAAGVTLKDLQAIAQELGLTVSDIPTPTEIARLRQAMNEADFKAFTDTFAGQLDRLNRSFEIFGVDDAKDKFARLVTLLTDPKVGAPSLFSGLAGLDLSSAAGLDSAKKQIQDLFTRAASGQLTSDDLNGMNLQQFLDALSALMGFLNDAAGTVQAAKSSLQALADALKDIDDSAQILGTSKADQLREKVAAYGKVFPELAGILDGLDLSKAEDLEALKQRLRDVFTMFHDGAAQLPDGTSLDDLIQAILALMGAAGDAADGITSAAQQMADAASALSTKFDIMGTVATDQAQQLADVYGLGSLGDLSTQAGRDAAIKHLQDLYASSPANKDLADHIAAVLRIVRGIKDEASGVGDAGSAGLGDAVSAVGTSTSVAGLASASYAQMDSANFYLSFLPAMADSLQRIRDAFLGGLDMGGPVTATIGTIGPINVEVSGVSDPATVHAAAAAGAQAGIDTGLAQIRLSLRAAAGAPRTA
ncbi:MAG: hypothetical protein U9Q74_16855, partial [Gemmatimonadota bacterium]|nr:hypothetical protein [Gemmatimonadota bacterium]